MSEVASLSEVKATLMREKVQVTPGCSTHVQFMLLM